MEAKISEKYQLLIILLNKGKLDKKKGQIETKITKKL